MGFRGAVSRTFVHAMRDLEHVLKVKNEWKNPVVYEVEEHAEDEGDFGWAVHNPKNLKGDTVVGTRNYIAPEMLSGEEYDHKVDIWSLGVVAYEMLVGELPFFGVDEKELEHNILTSELKIPGYLSKSCSDLLMRLLTRDPSKRITLEELLKHPWVVEMHSPKKLKEICLGFIRETNSFWVYDISKLDPKLVTELAFDIVHHRFLSE